MVAAVLAGLKVGGLFDWKLWISVLWQIIEILPVEIEKKSLHFGTKQKE